MDWLPAAAIRPFERRGVVHPEHPGPEDYEIAAKARVCARELVREGRLTAVLDGIAVALPHGLLSLDSMLALRGERPSTADPVLAALHACPEIIDRADVLAETIEVRHPSGRGLNGQRGIEF